MSRERAKNILGIDPGSHACGFGVISTDGGGGIKYLASGKIVLRARDPLYKRLKELYDGLLSVIREYGPAEASVERVFFAKSARSALSLGHARGVVLLSAASEGLPVYEYTALEVKKAVTGYGRAEKTQVQEMVKAILGVNNRLSADSADALAIALCHINSAVRLR